MSFIWSDTGKKVAVALKCYPWLLFCLSCSDFSILAVTAFPKSLCFISKHRQFLHKICIALIAFFWLFNWSSLKMDAQELQWSSLGRLCIFSAVWNGKEAGGISEISFFFPFSLFSLPQEGAWITGIPAVCFPQSCCSAVSASMQGLVLCHLHHLECGWAGFCVGGGTKLGSGSMNKPQCLLCWG